MDLFFYYILRRFFVKLQYTDNALILEKGIFIRRISRIPFSVVVKAEITRTPLMRILGAKRVRLYTLCGGASLLLRKGEPLPFLPEGRGIAIRPRLLSVVFGAFIDTRALGGAVVFSAAMRRIGTLSERYYESILSAISDTADGLSDTLTAAHIAVPRIAAVLAVFTAAAWIFAFLKRLVSMARFSVSSRRGYITVRHGLATLYEYVLVPHSPCVPIICDTVTTLAFGCAPIYCRGIMLLPPTRRSVRERAVSVLCGLPPAPAARGGHGVFPPPRALFGFCAVPLGWGAAFAAALAVFGGRGGELLSLVLWLGLGVCVWTAAVYGVYLPFSGAALGRDTLRISSRGGARLYTYVAPLEAVVAAAASALRFRRNGGYCVLTVMLVGRERCRLRSVPYDKAIRLAERAVPPS